MHQPDTLSFYVNVQKTRNAQFQGWQFYFLGIRIFFRFSNLKSGKAKT